MSSRNIRGSALALLSMLSLLFSAAAMAQAVDHYEYEKDRIYPVRTGLGLTTQIELSPNEKILDYSTGFSSGWELTRRENVFYLKPKNVDVDTNMMVRTETHSYIFELKVVATDWRQLEQARRAGVQYKIAFVYPNDTVFGVAQEAVEEEAKPLLSSELAKDRQYNFNYSYSTSKAKKMGWLIPVNAYDDGRFTYLKLPNSPEYKTGIFPAVFGRETEYGEDFVVNTTVEGNTLIVHGTHRTWSSATATSSSACEEREEMSQQNTPGNDPNNGRDESQSPYGAQGASDAQSNPYFGTTQAEPAPDLDAAAPQLRSAEEQRLNRKALLFLGGIVVLLVAMGFLLFRKGQDDKDAVQKVPDVARVSTPTLPDAVQTSPVPSQAMQPVDPIPMTPPLPPPPLDSTPLFVPQSDSAREMDRGPTLLDRRIGSGSGWVVVMDRMATGAMAAAAWMSTPCHAGPAAQQSGGAGRFAAARTSRMSPAPPTSRAPMRCWCVAPTCVAYWKPASSPISPAIPRAC